MGEAEPIDTTTLRDLRQAIPDPPPEEVPNGAMPPSQLADMPAWIKRWLYTKGVVLLTLNQDNTIGIAAAGVNHWKINELLSVGIHLNLQDHDRQVASGAAGPDAQKRALELAKQ